MIRILNKCLLLKKLNIENKEIELQEKKKKILKEMKSLKEIIKKNKMSLNKDAKILENERKGETKLVTSISNLEDTIN
jgi:hypothetical protein